MLLARKSAESGTVSALVGAEAGPFSVLAIGLIICIIACVILIFVLVNKIAQNALTVKKLENRARGLHQSLMMEVQKEAKEEATVSAMQHLLAKEQKALEEEELALGVEAGMIEHRIETRQDRMRLTEIQVDAQTRSLIEDVHRRGKVFVDLEARTFKILKTIQFKEVLVTQQMMKDCAVPPAEYEDPTFAMAVLGDLALLLSYIKKATVLIEGHTAGGTAAMDDVGFVIASERAEKVVDSLISLGIPEYRLESKGMPGLLGDNTADTKIVTLFWGV